MKRFSQRIFIIVLILITGAAAQTTFDLSGGLGGMAADWCHCVHPGGMWTTVNATGLFTQHLGISADFSLHAAGKVYGVRPFLADVNLAMRASRRRVTPELDLGWGGASIPTGTPDCIVAAPGQFPITPCGLGGRNFVNGAHMSLSAMVQLSGGWFVRPVYNLYVGKNMGHPQFFGAMIGYEFGGH